jgi:tetratricopeptide (TPR) repeat protein
MIKQCSHKSMSAVVLLACFIGLAVPAYSGAPPSGEAPRMMPDREQGDSQGKSKEPLITLANRQAMLADLYDQLAKTKDPEAAQPLVAAIWKVWVFSGSATSDLLLERARASAMEPGGVSSLSFLTAVVELQPDFAQAWFLRAMTFKLQNDSHRMLGDLRRTLALDPNHFEALKALAFELNELGRKKQAIEAFDKLLKVYPAAGKSIDPVLQSLTRDLGGQEL